MMYNGYGTAFGMFGDWVCGPGAFFPGPLGWIITLLFWALILFIVVRIFLSIFSRDNESVPSRLDMLKDRYARGDIDEDEYRRMKIELT